MARKNEPYIYQVLRRETPNPRQQAFFRAEAANVAYGGARGGGKSWAMRRKLVLLAMRYPGLKLLLLRRTLRLREGTPLPCGRSTCCGWVHRSGTALPAAVWPGHGHWRRRPPPRTAGTI